MLHDSWPFREFITELGVARKRRVKQGIEAVGAFCKRGGAQRPERNWNEHLQNGIKPPSLPTRTNKGSAFSPRESKIELFRCHAGFFRSNIRLDHSVPLNFGNSGNAIGAAIYATN